MNRNQTILLGAALAAGSLLPSAARAVQISEVLYDAVGTDNATTFVELWGTPGTSLDGWHLEGVNGADGALAPILTLSGQIGADGFFVVADSDAGTTQVANADLLLNFDLQNGPDSLVLRDALGNVLDALGYGVFAAADVFAGEGSAAPDGIAGQSLARVFANRDSNDNLADFALLDIPTPGSGPVAVPEAGAAAPLTLFAAALGLIRHRRSRVPSVVH
jgi:Lamin Tail Domain